jgi:CheY-like chemotaxis protein
MPMRVTIIENTRETQIQFLKQLPSGVDVEVQPITAAPFFDEKIERVISEFNPDLIILDLLLSVDIQSGFRVLRYLKESKSLKDIPVVVCSKFVGDEGSKKENKKTALELGAVATFSKEDFPKPTKFLQYAKSQEEKALR